MEIITIANISGFIAVAIVIVQFLVPNLLVILLSNSLGSTNTAVTWSVAGRVLHNSNWPTILRTDAAAGTGVKRSVQAISWARALGLVLISVAGIVTPLGLYEDLVVSGTRSVLFTTAVDSGPFGYARLPRSELGFNRMCGAYLPVLCPGISDPYNRTEFPNGTLSVSMDYWDGRIPQSRFEFFESGLSRNSSTISSFWDIEWRAYNFNADKAERSNELTFMNGSRYIYGTFQNFDSLFLSRGIHLIDGLILNTDTGAIGFRNHSIPTNLNNSIAKWEEDILFVEPETACVPNNLTLQFTIDDFTNARNFSDMQLIDQGGFANFDLEYHIHVNGTDAQNNLNLTNRAHIAATISNFLTAAYYNLTDLNRTYMTSALGNSYEVGFSTQTPVYWDRWHTSETFSDFLMLQEANYSKYSNSSPLLTSTELNPWNVSVDDFNAILDWCGWFMDVNPGNISTVAVGCNMAYGVARPLDNISNNGTQGPFGFVHEAGTRFAVDLYSCATAVKASIKTVDFSLNGTALSDVQVTSITDKAYSSPTTVPWWGVEDTYMKLSDGVPIWGLVDPDLPQPPNISFIQREYLYLPGLVTNYSAGMYSSENLPGVDFASPILAALAYIGTEDQKLYSDFKTIDYSGVQSVAMLQRWSELSGSADGMAQIHQIIWGDIAANAIVGTKGMAGSSPQRQLRMNKRDTDGPSSSSPNSGSSNTQIISISTRRVLYRWPFGIPAFLVAAMIIIVTLSTLLSCCCINRSPYHSLLTALQRTSAGRILGAAVYPHAAPPEARTKEWIERVGEREVTFVRGLPTGSDREEEKQLTSGDLRMRDEKRMGPRVGIYERVNNWE